MEIKKLYASLNILYLKLYQYQKYIDRDIINNIFDCVDLWLEGLSKIVDFKDMSLEDMCDESEIEVFFDHSQDKFLIELDLVKDLEAVKCYNLMYK